MKKILNPGTSKTWNGRSFDVFVHVGYKEEGGKKRLSISGVEGPLPSGNCLGSCGQILGNLKNINKLSEGWTPSMLRRLVQVWKTWHLNDMRAGCEHQRAAKWEDVRINPDELPNSYANRDKGGILAMWVYKSEHPKGLLCEPCPVCGYKYGSAWLYEPVPDDVIAFLESLPDSKLTPAWI